MNINHSDEGSSCAVKSKYFTRGSAMDESLSDFQEPKKNCAGPKNTARNCGKPKKARKRLRGQKDIRTAIKSTKKELESYSKDFDKVCKKAGIDVDPEELQLAIALSKSLQEKTSTTNKSAENSQSSTSQGRIGKIRTTLQEYGFKVPEVKIAGNTRKITHKHKKNYKLLQTSDIEKKEIISEKYSQILFQNISHCTLYSSEVDVLNIPIYYLSSNVPYNILKVSDTFYSNNLVEKSSKNGNLLRDWSTIPGRPQSPKLSEPMSMNFSEIECSQDELDIVLSGTIKSCRDIVIKKIKDWKYSNECRIVVANNISIDDKVNKGEINTNNLHKDINEDNNDNSFLGAPVLKEKQYRSCSPDMFDDDKSDLYDDSKNHIIEIDAKSPKRDANNFVVMDLTQQVYEKSKFDPNSITKIKANDLMELTECITLSQNEVIVVDETLTQLSEKSDMTKRKSNDFMELTKCVASTSQPLENNIDPTETPEILEEKSVTILKSNNIDLLDSPKINDCNANAVIVNIPKENNTEKDIESTDLTQSSDTSDELPFVSLTGIKDKSFDDTVIMDVDYYTHNNNRKPLQIDTEIHIDLTQCAQKENKGNIQSLSFFEEYNHDHSKSTEEDKETATGDIKSEENTGKDDITQSTEKIINCNENYFSSQDNNIKSLTQHQKSSQIIKESIPVKVHRYEYPNSSKVDLTIEPTKLIDDNCFEISKIHSLVELNCNSQVSHELSVIREPITDIDLTQKSDDSDELSQTSKISTPNTSKDLNHAVQLSQNSRIFSPNKATGHDYNSKATIHDITEVNGLSTARISIICNSIGKKDNVSIDYDDIINTNNENNNTEKNYFTNPNDKLSRNNSMLSICSQYSEVFDLIDKELDYSLQKSKLEIPKDNFAFGGISIMDDLSNVHTSEKCMASDNNTMDNLLNEDVDCSFIEIHNEKNLNLYTENRIDGKKNRRCNEISPIKHRRITEIATPQKASSSNIITVTTPKNSELIIKTNNVTPMIDYDSMSTPEIHKELDKYGIKPFKRKRAIQLLTHIYNQTHPIIENADELASPPKRHKPNDYLHSSPRKVISPRKLITSPSKYPDIEIVEANNIVARGKDNNLIQNSAGENRVTKGKGKGKGKRSCGNQKENVQENQESIQNRSTENEYVPSLKEIECSSEDWVFQKREKAKVHSCRVPLHIAFYNYVYSRPKLREAILSYEPVEIDLIHKDLVGYGHRYDPKDLLKFLDKKCITVKTTDNDARNQKR